MHGLLKNQTFSFARDCCGGGLKVEREEQGNR